MRIWKYELPVQEVVTVPMPIGSKVLTAQAQRGAVTIWAEVNPEAPRASRSFRIVGTDHPFDPVGLQYIATVQTGLFVWHVYELEG